MTTENISFFYHFVNQLLYKKILSVLCHLFVNDLQYNQALVHLILIY
jgi:hypothetical protein